MSILVVCTLFPTNVFAISDYKASESFEKVEEIASAEDIIGTKGETLEQLFSPIQKFDTFQPELSEVKITYDSESDRICFYGRLTLSEGQYDILSEGNVYKNVKTENAKTYDNIVLAEMDNSEKWHFVQLKIEKNNVVNLILQNIDTGSLYQFKIETENSFDKIYGVCKNSLEGKPLEEKIMKLYSVHRNLIDAEEETVITESISFDSSDINNKKRISTLSNETDKYSEWKRLYEDSYRKGTVDLDNYDLSSNYFSTTGKHNIETLQEDMDNGKSTSPHIIVYTVENGTGVNLVQIVLGYYTFHEPTASSVTMQFSFGGSAVFEYTKSTKKATCLYVNPTVFEKCRLCLSCDSSEGIFIDRYVDGQYFIGSGAVKELLVIGTTVASNILNNSVTSTVMSYLTSLFSNNDKKEAGNYITYPKTVEEQKIYNDGPINVIGVSLKDGDYLGDTTVTSNVVTNDYLVIEGSVKQLKEKTNIQYFSSFSYKLVI